MIRSLLDALTLLVLRLLWDPWILTVSGKRVRLLRPDPAAISIEDIAHALSQINRFTGHTSRPYSVAQHSVHVMRLAHANIEGPAIHRRQFLMACLMHDSHEAFLGDVSSPLKRLLSWLYGPLERMWEDAVASKFRIRQVGVIMVATGATDGSPQFTCVTIGRAVKYFDLMALATERRDLLAHGTPKGCFDIQLPAADPELIDVLTPVAARDLFLREASNLGLVLPWEDAFDPITERRTDVKAH